jgi:hypothetical protein
MSDESVAAALATAPSIHVSGCTRGRLRHTSREAALGDLLHSSVPIALFVCVTYGLRIVTDAVMRYLMIRTNPSEEVVRTLLREESRMRRQGALRWGLILAFSSASLAVLQWTGWTGVGPGPIGLVVGAIALGNLAFYALSTRSRGD